MGTKLQPGNFDCYANAEPDEPMFILLARDLSAPHVVRGWAINRELAINLKQKPESDRAAVKEAFDCAEAMVKWREKNRSNGK